jgi:hypothetical protein
MVRSIHEAARLCSPDGLLEIEVEGLPSGSRVAVPNAGFKMQPGAPGTATPPPRIDEHRDEILQWLAADQR